MEQMNRNGRARDLSDIASFDGMHKELTERIIACAFKVHRTLLSGFVESVYENALAVEFERQGIPFKRQVPIEVRYAGKVVGQHRLDLLVDDKVVVELKAKEALTEADFSQADSYLRATGLYVALVLNFGTPKLEIKRRGNIDGKIKAFQRSSVQSV